MAEVTIGVAVYNGAGTLEAALDSLLAQTFKECRIVISDNASTDATRAICERYASAHTHIQYIRRSATLAVADHYRIILQESVSPYFMWAAADDLWAPDFVKVNHEFLSSHPNYVASQSRVLFQTDGFPSRMAKGTYPLSDNPRRNAARFFDDPADNSRFTVYSGRRP